MARLLPLIVLVLVTLFLVLFWPNVQTTPDLNLVISPTANRPSINTPTEPAAEPGIKPADPVADWLGRVTKKPFGLYVTPDNSPVQPERFTGYHTAVDIEFEDAMTDIPVYALADGAVKLARTANGYGGVLVLGFSWEGQEYTAIYGHLRPNSLPAVGTAVRRGEQLAVLGTGFSTETDGERPHLHFGLHRGSDITLAGYVDTKDELDGWLDPLLFYN